MREAAPPPDSLGHFSALRIDDMDRLWVGGGGGGVIFDSEGRPVAKLNLELPRFRPMQIGEYFVLGVQASEEGVERVVRYGILRS